MPVTRNEFISEVKNKYPQYASINDDSLFKAIIQKYPTYIDQIIPEPAQGTLSPPKVEPLSFTPEFTTAQPATTARPLSDGSLPGLDPKSEAVAKGGGIEPIFSKDPRSKSYRFRTHLTKEAMFGYPELGLDKPQTTGEMVADIGGSIAGVLVSIGTTGAGVTKALGFAGSKLPRVTGWINKALRGNKTAKDITFATARDILTFNIHGQAYNRPDIKTFEDRVDLVLENTLMALAFSGAGALRHIPKYGKKLSTTAVGVIGWEMGGDTFEEKAINSIALMGLHGLFNTKKDKVKTQKSMNELLTTLYPNLSKKEAIRIVNKTLGIIQNTRTKLPKELQKNPLELISERAESIRLARPIGESFDPVTMPHGRPLALPEARTATGFEPGSQVRIKGAGRYAGIQATVRELRPDGKVKVYLETRQMTKTGGRNFKGERIFTTEKLEPVQPIEAKGEVRIAPEEQLSFELKQVETAVNKGKVKPKGAKLAQEEYINLHESEVSTRGILENSKLTAQQRIAHEHYLEQVKKLKQELLDLGSIELYSGFPVHEMFKSKRSIKDLTPKEIDLLYRDATKKPLIDIDKVMEESIPKDLVGKKTAIGLIRRLVDGAKQARNRVKTKEGKQIMDGIESADEHWHSLAGKYVEKLRSLNFDQMTEKEGIKLGKALQKGQAPQIKRILDDIHKRLTSAGLKVGYIKNYFPRVWKQNLTQHIFEDLTKLQEIMINSGNKSDKIIASHLKDYSHETIQLVNHLIKTGQAKSYSKAISKLKSDVSTELFPEASFEKPRRLDLPAWVFETDARKVIPHYIDVTTKRISLVEKFGANGEKAIKNLEKINAVDPNEAKLVHEIIDMYTGNAERINGYKGITRELVNAYYGFEVATKIGLGTATVPNITQTLISTLPEWGAFRVIKGGVRLFDPSVRSGIRSSGIFRESMINAFAGVEPTGVMGAFAKLTTKLGFNQINKANLYLSASTFEVGVKDLMKIAKGKGLRADWAKKRLGDFNIDHKNPLSDEKLVKKMYRFSVDTQLQKNVLKDPKIFNDPKWKPLFLFKRFGVRQTTMVKDMVMREVKRGNVMPILRLMVSAPLGGEFVIFAKNKIKSIATGDEYYRKEELFTIERFVNNIAAVGSFGIISDFMEADELSDMGSKIKFTATPVFVNDANDLIDTYTSVMEDYEKYGDGFLAVRRNTNDVLGLFGSIPRYIGKQTLTTQQSENRASHFRGRERTAILDLMLVGETKKAKNRLRLWNKHNPDSGFTIDDISPKELMKRAKRKHKMLIKAKS